MERGKESVLGNARGRVKKQSLAQLGVSSCVISYTQVNYDTEDGLFVFGS